jgi:hypothetical protein
MSALDKYLKKVDDSDFPYLDNEGVSHPDKESFICSLFGFCSCGLPAAALDYIYGVLEIMGRFNSSGPSETWEETHDELDKHFNSVGEAYFVYYFLNSWKIKMAEHGWSVPGWLTDFGRDVLEMLKEYRAERGE